MTTFKLFLGLVGAGLVLFCCCGRLAAGGLTPVQKSGTPTTVAPQSVPTQKSVPQSVPQPTQKSVPMSVPQPTQKSTPQSVPQPTQKAAYGPTTTQAVNEPMIVELRREGLLRRLVRLCRERRGLAQCVQCR